MLLQFSANTPMSWAAMTAEDLLAKTPIYWCRPLNYAIRSKSYALETVLTLVDGGADVNSRDSEGETPLDFAVEFGREEVAQYLRTRGAKRSAKHAATWKSSSKKTS